MDCVKHTGIYKLLALGSMLVLAGCGSSGFKLMPPPAYVGTDAYQEGVREYYAEINAGPEARIFYATDRAPDSEGTACNYANARGDYLRLGEVRTVIGDENWSLDELGENINAGEELIINCLSHDEIGPLYTSIPPTSQDGIDAFLSDSKDDPVRASSYEFARRVNEHMKSTRFHEINIFVSGLSTSFGNSVKHATAFHHYTVRSGAMIAYPWPVGNTPFSANKDRLSGRVSARGLRNLILFLAENTEAERINIIGYSAGAEVLSYALYQLRLAYAEQPVERIHSDLKLGSILLTAPDADYMEFRNMLMDGLLDMAQSFTVYVNPEDQVMVFSERFSSGAPRLGNPRDGVSQTEMDIYRNVEGINFVSPENGVRILGAVDSLGHSYWYLNPWVSSDALITLTTQLPPKERGLMREGESPVWQFPDDYLARTEALFREYRLRDKQTAQKSP